MIQLITKCIGSFIGFRTLSAVVCLLCATSVRANPLTTFSAADPCILNANGKTYLYHTGYGRGQGAFPILVAKNASLTSWTQTGTILRIGSFPAWAKNNSRYWAPEVHLIAGSYVSYFSGEDKHNRFCIGTAVADKPDGPFVARKSPLVSDAKVGLIDPTYYRDPVTGQGYVVWKVDGNGLSPQIPTNLVMQKVSSDGLTVIGKPWNILQNTAAWEGELVEGPSFLYRHGYYYLFYSGNVYSDDRYAVGVARSKSVAGPYEKYEGNPILKSDAHFSGPGHQFLVRGSQDQWTIFYHARDKSRQEGQSARLLMMDNVEWAADGWPRINNGTPSHN